MAIRTISPKGPLTRQETKSANVEEWDGELLELLAGQRLSKGKKYLKDGLVSDLYLKGNTVSAEVEGSGSVPYKLKLEFEPYGETVRSQILERVKSSTEAPCTVLFKDVLRNRLYTSCTCKDETSYCAHTIACMLALEYEMVYNPSSIMGLLGFDSEEISEFGKTHAPSKEFKIPVVKSSKIIPDNLTKEIFGIIETNINTEEYGLDSYYDQAECEKSGYPIFNKYDKFTIAETEIEYLMGEQITMDFKGLGTTIVNGNDFIGFCGNGVYQTSCRCKDKHCRHMLLTEMMVNSIPKYPNPRYRKLDRGRILELSDQLVSSMDDVSDFKDIRVLAEHIIILITKRLGIPSEQLNLLTILHTITETTQFSEEMISLFYEYAREIGKIVVSLTAADFVTFVKESEVERSWLIPFAGMFASNERKIVTKTEWKDDSYVEILKKKKDELFGKFDEQKFEAYRKKFKNKYRWYTFQQYEEDSDDYIEKNDLDPSALIEYMLERGFEESEMDLDQALENSMYGLIAKSNDDKTPRAGFRNLNVNAKISEAGMIEVGVRNLMTMSAAIMDSGDNGQYYLVSNNIDYINLIMKSVPKFPIEKEVLEFKEMLLVNHKAKRSFWDGRGGRTMEHLDDIVESPSIISRVGLK